MRDQTHNIFLFYIFKLEYKCFIGGKYNHIVGTCYFKNGFPLGYQSRTKIVNFSFNETEPSNNPDSRNQATTFALE